MVDGRREEVWLLEEERGDSKTHFLSSPVDHCCWLGPPGGGWHRGDSMAQTSVGLVTREPGQLGTVRSLTPTAVSFTASAASDRRVTGSQKRTPRRNLFFLVVCLLLAWHFFFNFFFFYSLLPSVIVDEPASPARLRQPDAHTVAGLHSRRARLCRLVAEAPGGEPHPPLQFVVVVVAFTGRRRPPPPPPLIIIIPSSLSPPAHPSHPAPLFVSMLMHAQA